MTFAHYHFKGGSSIHEHFHPQEEVCEVIEGELEMTIDDVTQIARAGLVAIVPSNARHSVKALNRWSRHHRGLSVAPGIRLATLRQHRQPDSEGKATLCAFMS
jgi:uncharacterized cupin superfamily protein